jgi:phage shock protein C
MNQKLYRSRTDVIIAGVCSGLGQYLDIDPTLVRLFFLLLAFTNGMGVLIYVFLWVVLPTEDRPREASWGANARFAADEMADQARRMGSELRQAIHTPSPRTGLYIGGGLLIIGVWALLRNLNLPWLAWLEPGVIWPALLILAGIILLFRSRRGE